MSVGADERRVLIVDDDRDFVETIEEILATRGYQVTVAGSTDEARLRAQDSSAEVALVDIRLGRANGIDLLSELRIRRPGLVCVMMTAYADVETAVRALEQGAYHYLRKPVDVRDLLSTLDRCFEKARLEHGKAAAEEALKVRNAELAEVNERLRQMVASAQQLASCVRLEDLSQSLLREFAAIMAAGGGSLFFVADDALERVCSLDETHVPERIPLPLPADSVFARALELGQPLLVRDISREPGLRGSGWHGYGDGSLLIFPITLGAEVSALLSLHNRRWPPFTEQDVELGQIMISLSSEILKAQRATEAVSASERRYRLLAENAMDVIGTTDESFRLTYVSPSITRLTGYSAEEVLARGLPGIVTRPSLAAARRVARSRLRSRGPEAGGAAPTLDLELRCKTGATVLAEVTISPLHGAEGEGLLGVARDATARRVVEAQLNRLATAVEQAAEDVIITDSAGIIQYVNPGFERATGYSRQEAVGQTPRILRSGAHEPGFYRDLWRTISEGRTWRGRVTNRRKDGTLILEEGTISPIRGGSGRIIGYVSVKSDVTRQVSLEARVAQMQKMEAVGRLAGGLAHDFNNVLSAIFGFVDLADLTHPESEKLRRYTSEIRSAARRAADLTRQMLAFSRKSTLERRPVELRLVVGETVRLMRAALPATIEIREALESEAMVLADPTQLHQVVMNLCTNAGLAMRDGGGVMDVSVSDMELGVAEAEICPPLRPGPHVSITVSDTGCGMMPDVMAHIFEPFFTTRDRGEGSGMGLAVVHGIVEDHRGAVTVSSTSGAGSTFRVLLPVIPSAEESAEESPARGSERVLVVDGEEAQARITQEMLSALGYAVTVATSAREALELMRARPDAYDVVVTDAAPPGMKGAALAAELLRMRREMPIVLCSEQRGRLSPTGLRALGIREWLAKPISLAALSTAIRRALGPVGPLSVD